MARTFAYISKELNLKSKISSRNKKKGLSIAQEFDLDFIEIQDLSLIKDSIICNATPMCMESKKNTNFDDLKKINIKNNCGVFDSVITNKETWFIKNSKLYNLPYVEGNQLALEQAHIQFELYTGKKIPKHVLSNSLL